MRGNFQALLMTIGLATMLSACVPARFEAIKDRGELFKSGSVFTGSNVEDQSEGGSLIGQGSDGGPGAPGYGADGSGSPGNGSDGSGMPPVGGDGSGAPPAGGDGSGPQVPIVKLCSTDRTADSGSNVVQASALQLTVKDASSGQVVCQVTEGVKAGIVNDSVLDLKNCALPGNKYKVYLNDPAKNSKSLLFDSDNLDPDNMMDYITIKRADSASPFKISGIESDDYVQVLYALNEKQYAKVCDEMASPLVVDTTPAGEMNLGLQMSSQLMGVLFDIMGLNALPVPHTKQRISSIQNPRYMFLTLPKRRGGIEGVDQLFGNNTQGPDGKFAANGFLALAKYDTNADGVIDAEDPVFKQLRLWSDLNKDGISQPNELVSLPRMKMVQIDLNYDPNFFERDQFGNESRLKSAVKLKDGSLKMIFDLWFNLAQ